MNTSTASALSRALFAAGFTLFASAALSLSAASVPAAPGPYRVLNTAQFPGTGGLDYVFADNDARKLYVPRGTDVLVFDLDTLKDAGKIPNARSHGAVVDPKSGHGFCSGNPVVMWDTTTLATIKTIQVQSSSDGIFFEPATQRVWILSHGTPNVTVINPENGEIVGTIADIGSGSGVAAPEQAAADGKGNVYIDVENQASLAVVDAKTLKVTGHYDLSSKGSTPAGLAFDVKNGILFAMCRAPAPGTCVILSAADGKIITSLPLGGGSDGGVFNPATMEAFSSSGGGNGTLTVIKENSPTSFEVEQTVVTKSGAKTLTLDTKNNRVIVITTEAMPPAATPPVAAATPVAPVASMPASPVVAGATPPAGGPPLADGTAPVGRGGQRGGGRGGRGGGGPAFLDLIVVGR